MRSVVQKQAATWIRLGHVCGTGKIRGCVHSAGAVDCWPLCDSEGENSSHFIFRRFSSATARWESSEVSTLRDSEVNESSENGRYPILGGDQPIMSSPIKSRYPILGGEQPVLPSPIKSRFPIIGGEQPVLSSLTTLSKSNIDLRELIASKERELEILKSALRDKELGDSLLQKHNIKVNSADVSASGQESTWKTPEPSVGGDGPMMFGKLNIADFPSQQDSHYEKLQRRRKRKEMMQQSLRNGNISSPFFGASTWKAPSVDGESGIKSTIPGESSPSSSTTEVVPYRPNAHIFDKEEGPYKSLADRLYEEHFGHPAPKNLERTYPPGSFYDRCMKEKKRKEREAAAAAVAAVSQTPSEKDSISTDSDISIVGDKMEDTSKVNQMESRFEDIQNSSTSAMRSMRGNSVNPGFNQDIKLGDWRCPECSFHNFSKNVHCYKCQSERPDGSVHERRAPTGRSF